MPYAPILNQFTGPKKQGLAVSPTPEIKSEALVKYDTTGLSQQVFV
jgi:hypothetical protein